MKKNLCLFLFLLITLTCLGQDNEEGYALTGKDFIYGELGGRFLLGFGVHYERRLELSPNISFVAGIGFGSSSRLDSDLTNWPLIAPVTGGFLIGKNRARFEIGISRLIVKKGFYVDSEGGKDFSPIAAFLGYRGRPKRDTHLFYKVDFLAYPAAYIGIFPYIGIGVGRTF